MRERERERELSSKSMRKKYDHVIQSKRERERLSTISPMFCRRSNLRTRRDRTSTVWGTLTCLSTGRCSVTWPCGSTRPWSNTWRRSYSPWLVSLSVWLCLSVCLYVSVYLSVSICLCVWGTKCPRIEANSINIHISIVVSPFLKTWRITLYKFYNCFWSFDLCIVVSALLEHEAIAGLTASKPAGMRGRSSSSAHEEEGREFSLDSLVKAVSLLSFLSQLEMFPYDFWLVKAAGLLKFAESSY